MIFDDMLNFAVGVKMVLVQGDTMEVGEEKDLPLPDKLKMKEQTHHGEFDVIGIRVRRVTKK